MFDIMVVYSNHGKPHDFTRWLTVI